MLLNCQSPLLYSAFCIHKSNNTPLVVIERSKVVIYAEAPEVSKGDC